MNTFQQHQHFPFFPEGISILIEASFFNVSTEATLTAGQASPQAELRAAAVRRMTARSAQRRAEAVPFAPPARRGAQGAQPKTPPLEVVTVDEAVGVHGGSHGFTWFHHENMEKYVLL